LQAPLLPEQQKSLAAVARSVVPAHLAVVRLGQPE
jgi:hypothetical protein